MITVADESRLRLLHVQEVSRLGQPMRDAVNAVPAGAGPLRKACSIAVAFVCGLLLPCAASCAPTGFTDLKCDADIPKRLTGRHMPGGRSGDIEARHRNLGLKDLGGSEVTDQLFLSSWRICGREYQWLEERSKIHDVLEFPPHSKTNPAFFGQCQINGKDQPDAVVAILEAHPSAPYLAVKQAWMIDSKKRKFVAVTTTEMKCPRDGIATADGGS